MSLRQIFRGGLVAFASITTPAHACPSCTTAQEVRAGIFNEQFAANVARTALPFGALLAITAAIHLGFPSRSNHDQP